MEASELQRREQIVQHLRLKREKYFKNTDIVTYNDWKESCISRILAEYKEIELLKYSLFHVLVGGGNQLDCEFFDLPGDLSIQKMIEDLPE
jgi:hypothetical protein